MKHCRELAKISQEEMAVLLSIEKDEYCKFENEQCLPSLMILFKFAGFFDIPMEDFIDDACKCEIFERMYDYFHILKFSAKYSYVKRYVDENLLPEGTDIQDFFKKTILNEENENKKDTSQ